MHAIAIFLLCSYNTHLEVIYKVNIQLKMEGHSWSFHSASWLQNFLGYSTSVRTAGFLRVGDVIPCSQPCVLQSFSNTACTESWTQNSLSTAKTMVLSVNEKFVSTLAVNVRKNFPWTRSSNLGRVNIFKATMKTLHKKNVSSFSFPGKKSYWDTRQQDSIKNVLRSIISKSVQFEMLEN